MLARLYSGLYKVSERDLLIMLEVQGIRRNDIDDYKFNEITKIEVEIQKNNIRLICANIGIVFILFLFIYEVF